MSSLSAKSDYTALELIVNFKDNLWSKKDEHRFPLFDPSVEINQVGSQTG